MIFYAWMQKIKESFTFVDHNAYVISTGEHQEML